jgi:hypothetical protein
MTKTNRLRKTAPFILRISYETNKHTLWAKWRVFECWSRCGTYHCHCALKSKETNYNVSTRILMPNKIIQRTCLSARLMEGDANVTGTLIPVRGIQTEICLKELCQCFSRIMRLLKVKLTTASQSYVWVYIGKYMFVPNLRALSIILKMLLIELSLNTKFLSLKS